MSTKRHLSDQEKIEVVSLYKSMAFTCVGLGKRFGISNVAIAGILKRRGVKILNDQSILQRKHLIDESYFDEINTEEKLYFSGLLFADGCNHLKKGVISISLQERDGYILEKFRKSINFSRPLKYGIRKNPNHQNIYTIDFSSRRISKKFESLGCVGNKTYRLLFPDWIDKTNFAPFVRGYFDGNGCISDRSASLASTTAFCEGLKNNLNELFAIDCRIKKKQHNSMSSSVIFSVSETKKFLNLIYKDSTLHLIRKYNKYMECINFKPNLSRKKNLSGRFSA